MPNLGSCSAFLETGALQLCAKRAKAKRKGFIRGVLILKLILIILMYLDRLPIFGEGGISRYQLGLGITYIYHLEVQNTENLDQLETFL